MCDFITRSSTLPFLEQISNTVVVDSAKYIWELIEGSGEKKYPHIKTKEQLSEKLHCHV